MTFEQLEKRYRPNIYWYALSLLKNREDAEDATQKAFIKAFNAFSRMRPDGNPLAWLMRITYRSVIEITRLADYRAQNLSLDEPVPGTGLFCDAEDLRPGPQLTAEAWEAYEALSPWKQQLVRLKAMGYDENELLSMAGGRTVSTPKTRLKAIRRQARQRYAEAV